MPLWPVDWCPTNQNSLIYKGIKVPPALCPLHRGAFGEVCDSYQTTSERCPHRFCLWTKCVWWQVTKLRAVSQLLTRCVQSRPGFSPTVWFVRSRAHPAFLLHSVFNFCLTVLVLFSIALSLCPRVFGSDSSVVIFSLPVFFLKEAKELILPLKYAFIANVVSSQPLVSLKIRCHP